MFTNFSIDSPEFEDKKGVFVFTIDGTVVYVGMTNDSLKKVIMGTYGNIIPRKLHKDGQLTACKLNAFLNTNHNKNIELWFIDCDDKEKVRQIKNELIDTYNPKSKLPPAEPVALIRHKWPATNCGKPRSSAFHLSF